MGRVRRRTGARVVQVLFGGTFDPVHNGHVGKPSESISWGSNPRDS